MFFSFHCVSFNNLKALKVGANVSISSTCIFTRAVLALNKGHSNTYVDRNKYQGSKLDVWPCAADGIVSILPAWLSGFYYATCSLPPLSLYCRNQRPNKNEWLSIMKFFLIIVSMCANTGLMPAQLLHDLSSEPV